MLKPGFDYVPINLEGLSFHDFAKMVVKCSKSTLANGFHVTSADMNKATNV